MCNPYIQQSKEPQLLLSFVCYADILGYKQLSLNAIEQGKGLQFLKKLYKALSNAYTRIREYSNFGGLPPLYFIKVFTDNIVIGFPLSKPIRRYGETEFVQLLSVLSNFQFGLAVEGFFIRGGIGFGEHYMDDDIVFGDALLEAVDQDNHGGPPCISLSPSVIELVRYYLGFFSQTDITPYYEFLLEDADGSIFINYLDETFIAYPDGPIFFDVIEKHKQNIIEGLNIYKGNTGIRAKYEWAARYHNFICQEFAERHPISYDPNIDPEHAAAIDEAQKLIKYKIDIESLAATPCRINLTPIKLE